MVIQVTLPIESIQAKMYAVIVVFAGPPSHFHHPDEAGAVYETYALRALFASLPSPPVIGLTMGIVTLGQLHTPGIGHMGQKQM